MKDKARAAEYNKGRRAWYGEHYICTNCGRCDALPGRRYCQSCIMADRARHKANPEYAARKKELRHTRIEAGLCPQCGRPALPGFKMCAKCRAARNDSTRKYKITKKIEEAANAARERKVEP